MSFRAETAQLLSIVTNSIYGSRSAFLRELISNSSDALEKLRHLRATGEGEIRGGEEMGIFVETDEANRRITVRDTGIGMTREEMIDCLGTIANSGSRKFAAESLKDVVGKEGSGEDGKTTATTTAAATDIIGKFGVGFYSAFMVGDRVDVICTSGVVRRGEGGDDQPETDADETPLETFTWSSTGSGSFTISQNSTPSERGCSVVIHLKEDALEYCKPSTVESVLTKYSNFVNHPVHLNGVLVNTMSAVWSLEPRTVSDDTHDEFYKYLTKAFDSPLYKVHYRADAPVDIKALLYVPTYHTEKHGLGRMPPGVSLYSRKVLIEGARTERILPDWMRFVKGVVDSEDLPLSVSREKAQDERLVKKLKNSVTRKFISELAKFARKDPEKYKKEFFPEFGHFIKEGVCQDYQFQKQLSELLYFETSRLPSGELTSLGEYVSRSPPTQNTIYYLAAPSRELALQSPYYEAFERRGEEVVFLYGAIDDFVMGNLEKFEGRKIVSAEVGGIEGEEEGEKDKEKDKEENDVDGPNTADSASSAKMSKEDQSLLCAWLQSTLSSSVTSVTVTRRLVSSPAVVTGHESGAVRRMMRMVDPSGAGGGGGDGGGGGGNCRNRGSRLTPSTRL